MKEKKFVFSTHNYLFDDEAKKKFQKLIDLKRQKIKEKLDKKRKYSRIIL